MGKAIADGGRGHRLEPETLDRLFCFGVLNDITEDKLPFPPGIASVNQGIYVFALEQLQQDLQTRLGFLNGTQVEMGGNYGQMCKSPFPALYLKLFRNTDFQQMADSRGEYIFITLKIILVLLKATQCLRDIGGDGRLFGYD